MKLNKYTCNQWWWTENFRAGDSEGLWLLPEPNEMSSFSGVGFKTFSALRSHGSGAVCVGGGRHVVLGSTDISTKKMHQFGALWHEWIKGLNVESCVCYSDVKHVHRDSIGHQSHEIPQAATLNLRKTCTGMQRANYEILITLAD